MKQRGGFSQIAILMLLAGVWLGCGPGNALDVDDVSDRGDATDKVEMVGQDDVTNRIEVAGQDGAGQSDATPPDPDVAAEVTEATTCEDPTGDIVDLFPAGNATQIHVAAAFDGEAIWVAFNAPDEEGGFDTWAARIGCDGSHLVLPFLLHDSPWYNELDPTVAVNGDNIVIAWQQDDGQFPNNLSVFYQVLSKSGELQLESPAELPVLAPDTEPDVNSWMPSITSSADGFEIATASGATGAQGFQVTVTSVDADGSVGEKAYLPDFQSEISQVYPTIGTDALSQRSYVAWTRTEVGEDDRVMLAWRDDGAAEYEPAIEALKGVSTANPMVGGGESVAFLAFDAAAGAGRDVYVAEAGWLDDPCRLGQAGAINHSPAVAVLGNHAAVAWYENMGGTKNKLWVQGCIFNSGVFAPFHFAEKANDAFAAPYQPAITHVTGSVVFVGWSEGLSPNFKAQGRFYRILD
jgi:hypothetical protein